MKHEEGKFPGPRGQQLYWQSWRTEGGADNNQCKGVVIIVHGLAEHSGRYAHVATFLVDNGYDVFALDHLGHGKSDGERCFVKTFADYMEPLHALVMRVKQEYNGKPVHMLGHSLGGLIANIYLLQYQNELSSAVLSSPLVMIRTKTSAMQSLIMKLISYLFPKAGVFQLDARQVCSDPKVVEDYINDPLVYSGKMTARLMTEIGLAMARVLDQVGDITLPMLVVQGGKDVLVDPQGAKFMHDNIGSSQKKLIFVDDSYHEVLNEPQFKQQAMRDIVEWLDSR